MVQDTFPLESVWQRLLLELLYMPTRELGIPVRVGAELFVESKPYAQAGQVVLMA
jgi:hypothetical protein